MNKRSIIITNFEDWTIAIIGKDGQIPARWYHYVRYTYYYLRYGRGLFTKRCISVLTRLFTRTLKPSEIDYSYCFKKPSTKEESERNKSIFARYNEIKNSLGKDDDVYEILKSEFNLDSRKEAFEIVLMELGNELDEMFRHNKSDNL